jgi:hypothetical protein
VRRSKRQAEHIGHTFSKKGAAQWPVATPRQVFHSLREAV